MKPIEDASSHETCGLRGVARLLGAEVWRAARVLANHPAGVNPLPSLSEVIGAMPGRVVQHGGWSAGGGATNELIDPPLGGRPVEVCGLEDTKPEPSGVFHDKREGPLDQCGGEDHRGRRSQVRIGPSELGQSLPPPGLEGAIAEITENLDERIERLDRVWSAIGAALDHVANDVVHLGAELIGFGEVVEVRCLGTLLARERILRSTRSRTEDAVFVDQMLGQTENHDRRFDIGTRDSLDDTKLDQDCSINASRALSFGASEIANVPPHEVEGLDVPEVGVDWEDEVGEEGRARRQQAMTSRCCWKLGAP